MYRFLFFIASLFLTPAAWAQPVTFGASVQLTGPVANTGRYYKDAYEFAVEKINQAKGEAAAMTEGALAFKEQRIAGAQADANAFVLRLEAYEHAPGLTKFRLQLETLEDVLPGMRKFVRPGAGDVKDMDIWLLQPIGPGQSK